MHAWDACISPINKNLKRINQVLFIATDSKNEKKKIKDSLKIEGDFIVLADNENKTIE